MARQISEIACRFLETNRCAREDEDAAQGARAVFLSPLFERQINERIATRGRPSRDDRASRVSRVAKRSN